MVLCAFCGHGSVILKSARRNRNRKVPDSCQVRLTMFEAAGWDEVGGMSAKELVITDMGLVIRSSWVMSNGGE